jgi:nicotinamide riboside kinase
VNYIKKIAIIGPESTGKSDLCKALALHYKTKYVPEVARDYLQKINRDYVLEDLSTIALQQLLMEETLIPQANDFLFCDTNLYVLKIWSEVKYKSCSLDILNKIANIKYDYYLLCNIDLPWQKDVQREHPSIKDRSMLFNMYLDVVQNEAVPFSIIDGLGDCRINNAIKIVDSII